MRFSWDTRKALSNLSKHGVSFPEAITVFGDELAQTMPDPHHSLGEYRFLTLGLSSSGRLLAIAHSEENGEIRVISARLATKRERSNYES